MSVIPIKALMTHPLRGTVKILKDWVHLRVDIKPAMSVHIHTLPA